MLCFVASKDATPILAQTPRLPSRSACEPSRACELAVSAVTSRSAAAALPGDEARPAGGLAEARRAGGLADERRTPLRSATPPASVLELQSTAPCTTRYSRSTLSPGS